MWGRRPSGRDARAGREAVLAVLRGAGAAASRAPDWVDFATDRFEPLTIESVEWAPGARERLSEVWERRGESKSLYASSAEFCAFCARRRFRLTSDRRTGGMSERRRTERPATDGAFEATESESGVFSPSSETGPGKWEVVLDGVSVRYDVREDRVFVRGGSVDRGRTRS